MYDSPPQTTLWALEELEYDEKPSHTVTVACGTGVYPFMKKIMMMINENANITINTKPIKNNFFGGGVNAGL